ncbi:uncharacterized protein C8Q71DRAFT_852330 [Rhodofomes roseus]|uniref:Cytochrome c oxidase subunit 8, mitochondrial n=1 Tax=Rhodofomes roseus TaxID=34475 RepID=A0ABQ8KX54_9APHY|nr:uncharacterized protein C8Q71DRAFT_852330 [Rhodofomes roseus]KAH9843806.1 hypothetical protein C8Q71DRAFT_852330 [Rhodofomes roseus]
MTLLTRASPALRQSLARSSARAPVRFSHGHAYTPADAVPFSFKSKGAFGAKVATYLLTGFAIPFVAAWYQLKKSGAGGA